MNPPGAAGDPGTPSADRRRDPLTRASWACRIWDETADPSVEAALRGGVGLHPRARTYLADLLLAVGRVDEAREVLEQGALRGESAAWVPLGNLYRDQLGDAVAARAAYLAGIEAGDLHAHHNLGVLLLTDGADRQAAIEHLTVAADGGDELAALVLREVIAEG